jgi:hypothetical protein
VRVAPPRRRSLSTPSRRLPICGRVIAHGGGLTPEAEQIVLQDYFDEDGGKAPRYYQVNAINAAIEAIAKGRDRILLVMATGTGIGYRAASSSHRTRRWRKGDSNSRSHPMRYVRKRLTPLSLAPVGDPGPGVRIDFPPAGSLQTFGSSSRSR